MNTCPTCGDQFDDDVAFCPTDGARLSAAPAAGELVGTIVADRYRITSRIGGGGMGQVYKAEHVRMKRTCAIKVLRSALTDDPEALQRFQREAENASQISHPNVAQIYDFGEHNTLVYLAMEFIEGESLAALLQRQPAVHPDEAADIIAQSAAALEAAHARGVLHRDVKPDNIMLARNADGTYLVKLVDFGIAREMSREEQRVTRTGLVIGTPEYMSPEQLAGEPLDARSDLYALALVAFQCLTGQQAFPSTSSKQNLILRLTSRPRTLQEVRADVPWPARLQAVFDRALASDPGDRYASVGAFAEELWAAIGAMAPSQTAELYRKALEQRVVNVASRTPVGDYPAVSTPRPVPTAGPPASAAPAPTVAAMATAGGALTATGTAMRPGIPIAPYRRRPRLMPWLLLIGLGGWAWVTATGRTAEARAMFDAFRANVLGLIGTTRKLTEEPAAARRSDAPASRAPARAPARAADDAANAGTDTDAAAAREAGAREASGAAPAVTGPALTVPPPTVRPPVGDSVRRPAGPPGAPE